MVSPLRVILMAFWPWRTHWPGLGSSMASILPARAARELVDSDPRQMLPLGHDPGMAGMIAEPVGNQESIDIEVVAGVGGNGRVLRCDL